MFPAPKSIERLGGGFEPRPQRWVVDPMLHPQGFELRIDETGCDIHYGARRGRRYAQQILDHLIENASANSGGVLIRDRPAITDRRFMLDVSRNRVPRRQSLRWLIECLDRLRFTALHLYIEHVYEYDGQDAIWEGAGALSASDLSWLDALCASLEIDLVVSTNCFGHMQRWLRHPDHRHRAECPEGSPALFDATLRAPPACLAATSGNAAFCVALIDQLVSNVSAPVVHVGGDEPFELGRGQSRARVERLGLAAVYGRHMARIMTPLIRDGYEVQYWGDVVAGHPEALEHLPESRCLPVVWHYEAPDDGERLAMIPPSARAAMGLPDDAHRGFVSRVGALARLGRPFGLAVGTSNCNTVFGRWANCRGNVADALSVAAEYGVDDITVTEWGDNGHLQPLAVAVPPMALAASALWTGSVAGDAAVTKAASRLLGDHRGELGRSLVTLGHMAEYLGRRCFNASPIVEELIDYPMTFGRGNLDRAKTVSALELVAAAVDDFATLSLDGDCGLTVREELHAAARLARHGLARLSRQAGAPSTISDHVRDFAEVTDLIRAAWRLSSREAGLDDSIASLAAPMDHHH